VLNTQSLRVSVVITVYNEAKSIQRLLDSLLKQDYAPDEVVICDGGSTDETLVIIDSYRERLPNLRVMIEPGANISRGRNLAIAAATGPIIAVTDAGVRLAKGWLENLIAPWQKARERGDPEPLAVAGFFLPEATTAFQTAMAATVLPLHADVDTSHFLPSSRSVAFLKTAWEAAGGYPEWLDYCEDLIFDLALNAQRPDQASAFVWAPQAIAYFQPRTSLQSFWRQYYRYARGDGKADLWQKRHAIRYATYLIGIPALLGHARFGLAARWLGWLGLLTGVVAYCARPWQRLWYLGRKLSLVEQVQTAAWVPIIRAVGDVAKMVGYPAGLWWRLRNRHRAEIHWRR
jgi:glycosyltransferase involved in cell wall biosynthesis